MRILLVQPAKAPQTIGGEDVFVFEPLALEYIAAAVAGHHDVKILDMRLDPELPTTLAEFRPDIVGITAYSVHVNTVMRLAGQVKQWNGRVFTIVGGHHATVRPEDVLGPAVDIVVMGEGVSPFREIVRRIEKGEGLEGIPGTCIRKNGEIARTAWETAVDLDALPFPARNLTAACRGRYYSEWMRPLASIRTSKGCPFRCSFCALWKLTGGKYFVRGPERIVEEISTIEEPYVFFADDESLIDKKRMLELARRIREAGIRKRYFLYGRSDTIVKQPELIEAWKEVGLERVFVGLEFYKDEDLEFIRKGSTAKQNEEAVRILHSLGIDIYASFIVRPEFERSDFRQFKKYCRRLKLDFASFSVLTPLPGTDFYDQVQDKLITRNYDHYDFLHAVLPTRLPLKDFYGELHRLYRTAIPLRRAISFLRKYPTSEIPSLLRMSLRVTSQIRDAYKHHDMIGSESA